MPYSHLKYVLRIIEIIVGFKAFSISEKKHFQRNPIVIKRFTIEIVRPIRLLIVLFNFHVIASGIPLSSLNTDLSIDNQGNAWIVSSETNSIELVESDGNTRIMDYSSEDLIGLAGLTSIIFDAKTQAFFVSDFDQIFVINSIDITNRLTDADLSERDNIAKHLKELWVDRPLFDIVSLAIDPHSRTLYIGQYSGNIFALNIEDIYENSNVKTNNLKDRMISRQYATLETRIVDMDVAPNGSVFVAEKNRILQVFENPIEVITVVSDHENRHEFSGIAFNDGRLHINTVQDGLFKLQADGTLTRPSPSKIHTRSGRLAFDQTNRAVMLSSDSDSTDIIMFKSDLQEVDLRQNIKTTNERVPRRIVGGNQVDSGQFLAVTFVETSVSNGISSCSGSLIAPQWILTAAHCVIDEETDQIVPNSWISICDDRTDRNTCRYWRVPTQLTVVHPQYVSDPSQLTTFDAALLKLSISITDIEPLKILDIAREHTYAPPGIDGFQIGWGQQSDGTEAAIKETIQTKIRFPDECLAEFRRVGDVVYTYLGLNHPVTWNFNSTICAGNRSQHASYGDSGGPLIVNSDRGWLQVGIASSLIQVLDTWLKYGGIPTNIYTRTSLLYDWIDQYADISSDRNTGALDEDLTLRNGEEFRDCEACPILVVIPSGSYHIGSPRSERGRRSSEGPQQLVTIGNRLAVGKFELTFREWDACVFAGDCRPISDNGWGRNDRPAINLNWNDAMDYIAWLSEQTGQSYRLLTEPEWEYVARGGSITRYHFGDDISRSDANYGNHLAKTARVGQYATNQFGLYDVHGNVGEWVQDCWRASLDRTQRFGTAWLMWDCSRRVVRGGNWYSEEQDIRTASRLYRPRRDRSTGVGFRVVRTLRSTASYVSSPSNTLVPFSSLESRRIGEQFVDCPDCPKMVVVPSGTFRMGSPVGEYGRSESEGPVHQVRMGSAFAVAIHEVTFQEWDSCVRDGGCGAYRPSDQGWGRAQRPVIGLSWHDAVAYTEWLSRKTKVTYRLLSEAEWEYVARAGTNTRYGSGNEISASLANYGENVGRTQSLSGESIRLARHAWKRLGMGRRLLECRLHERTKRRKHMDNG